MVAIVLVAIKVRVIPGHLVVMARVGPGENSRR
jgi:hypothetical protein